MHNHHNDTSYNNGVFSFGLLLVAQSVRFSCYVLFFALLIILLFFFSAVRFCIEFSIKLFHSFAFVTDDKDQTINAGKLVHGKQTWWQIFTISNWAEIKTIKEHKSIKFNAVPFAFRQHEWKPSKLTLNANQFKPIFFRFLLHFLFKRPILFWIK